jgi:hypothetical protein
MQPSDCRDQASAKATVSSSRSFTNNLTSMKTIFPLRLIPLFVALAIATPLVAAQKGFIGMQLDGQADAGSGLNFFNPSLMSGWVQDIVPKSPADDITLPSGTLASKSTACQYPGANFRRSRQN